MLINRRRHQKIDAPSATVLMALRDKYSIPEIARNYQVTMSTVYRWFKLREVRTKGTTQRFTKHDIHLIMELRDAGLTPKQIANKFDEWDELPTAATIRAVINGKTYKSYRRTPVDADSQVAE